MLALKGEDPMKIEIMMQKRGEYRPHQEFGINLAVPWSAGTKSDLDLPYISPIAPLHLPCISRACCGT